MMTLISAENDCREVDLAAELAFKTICIFNHNSAEFVNPFDGSGHGVIRYAWTASQYLELIVEMLTNVFLYIKIYL